MKSKNKYLRFKNFIGGWKVFTATIILFGAGSIAIAVTSGFPLPYDEHYHFALIQHYSNTFSPFITSQPAELAVVGDATRMGSYLMHYLLSFPLRIVELVTQHQQAQVIVLRLINIAFVIAALVLFRRILIDITKSGWLANASIGLLCLLPVTSLLAAHINYDNLMILAFAGLIVVAQSILQKVQGGERVSLSQLLMFVSIGLLACLVKFTFLPLAAIILAAVIVRVAWKKAWSVDGRKMMALIVTALLFVGAAGLFAERYGGNLVAYHTLQPDCDQVQQRNTCLQYGPWARNDMLEQAAANDTAFEGRSLEGYVANIWAPLMIRGLGGVDARGAVAEIPKPLLMGILIMTVMGTACILAAAVMKRRTLVIPIVVSAMGLYMVALLQRNYSEFQALHEIVAVQGRYMLPFIIPAVAIGYLGLRIYIRQFQRLGAIVVREARILRTLEPDQAFDRSADYWAAKVWRRSPEA